MDWISTDDTPDWKQGGYVELRKPDGTVEQDYLTFDVWFDSEGEIPSPELRSRQDFYWFSHWRPRPRIEPE